MNNVFLFPGQGSQVIGMGKHAFDHFPMARQTLMETDEALGMSLSKMMMEGPEEVLRETANAQPAILTVSVAIGRVLFDHGLKPDVMAGHSLGEYSALVMAEALRFEDAVRLVRARGRFMQEAVPLGVGAMSAILGGEDGVIEEVCAKVSAQGQCVEPANYNCPGQLVISGTVQGVEAASQILKEMGVKRIIPLSVSAPFHCSLLQSAAEKLNAEFERVDIKDPKIPYVANVDAQVVTSKDLIRQKLVDQVAKPVRWTQSLERILNEFRPDRMVEVGAGQVICGHLKKISKDLPRAHTDTLEALQTLLS